MYIEIHSQSVAGGMHGMIKTVEDHGNYKIVTATIDDHILYVRVQEGTAIPENSVWLRFPQERIKLYADGCLID
jgi:ABC-type sugar transport system ATPase subunit